MDMNAEYDALSEVHPKIAVAFMFFDLFKVSLKDSELKRGLHWSSCAVDDKLSDEQLLSIRAFLKVRKAELRTNIANKGRSNDGGQNDMVGKYGKMLWFFYHKILELNIFSVEIRREIRSYLDICEYILL